MAAVFAEVLARFPDQLTLVVHIRPDGSKYYRAQSVGISWNEDTLEALAAALLNTLINPPARDTEISTAPPHIDETSNPMDIVDSIEAARITGMTRHQIRAAIVKGKLAQVPDYPPISLRRGDVIEWAKRERATP